MGLALGGCVEPRRRGFTEPSAPGRTLARATLASSPALRAIRIRVDVMSIAASTSSDWLVFDSTFIPERQLGMRR